jgi:hypothetical protein
MDKDAVIDFTKENFAEMLGGLSVTVLVLMLLLFRKQYIVTFLGCIAIAAIGFERRARTFDRIISMLVVFMLALGFMLFD